MRSKKRTKKQRPGLRRALYVLLGVCIVFGVTFLVVAGSVFGYGKKYVSGDIAINLDEYKNNQSQTSVIYARNSSGEDKEMQRLYGTYNRIWVDIEYTNPYIMNCYIALEDKRFEQHSGVDWRRTFSAFFVYGGSQGGSTITQQLIKNLTDDDAVTFVRKFREILNALNMEQNYDKIEIMEAYLNTVYLSQGCYGVKTAAETYFNKDISELNLAESASIAAITQFPTKYDPFQNPENNKERQEHCLKEMLEQGIITQAEHDEAVAYELEFVRSYDKNDDDEEEEKTVYSWYTDFVIDTVVQDLMEQYGYTEKEAERMIYSGGLQIYSAVDLTVQESLESIYGNVNNISDPTAQSSMAVLDYSGRVVGIVGGVGEKQYSRVLNRASQSPRQPGSVIKPLSVYAPAIEYNEVHWSRLYQNSASLTIDGSPWPKNQGGHGNGEMVTIQYAVQQSLNTVPARILSQMGLEPSYKYLIDKFHLPDVTEEDMNFSSLAVGGMQYGTTTLDMAAAYQAFGNGGYYNQPYCYYEVTDANGNVILDRSNYITNEQIMSENTAEIMNRLLRTVMTSGTGTPYNVSGQTTFGKTGTTSDDKDRWFIGGTGHYVAAVWYGYDEPKEIRNVGTNPAGRLFKSVMDKAHSGLGSANFPTASSGVVSAAYCTATGNLASPGCPTATGYYRSGNMPDYCGGNHGGGGAEGEGETTTGDGSTTSGSGGSTTLPTSSTTNWRDQFN